MKRIFLGTTMVLAALNGFAQGVIVFNNRVVGSLVTHVYAPLTSNISLFQIGNGSNDYPVGSTSWAGFTPIGTNLSGLYGGTSTIAQLLIGPGSGAPESSLVPQTPTATFRTGAAAGFTQGGIVVTANNVLPDSPATVQMVVWDNSSGLYPTWTEASVAWDNKLIAAGRSGRWNTVLGGTNAPPLLTGLQSFNLSYFTPPVIYTQPQGQTVVAGQTASFSVVAQGYTPLYYQWRCGGMDISGATEASYSVTNAQPANSGAYSVRVWNGCGSTNSSDAQLDVRYVLLFGNGQPLVGTNYSYVGGVTLAVQATFTNGSIFYTLDGSKPSFVSAYYDSPFDLHYTATVRAIAYSADFTQSVEAEPINVTIIPTYTLSATTLGGGTVSLNPPGGPYASNTTVTVTATPTSGWTFLDWLGAASGTNPMVNITMTQDKTVQAVFGTSLSTTALGGGSVSLYPSSPLYPHGSVERLTATPQTGNYFVVWGNAASGNANPLYFTVTNPNPTISSVFTSLGGSQYALTVTPDGFGGTTVSPRANSYSPDSVVTLTAMPDSGQSFLGWGGDASGMSNPLAINMDQSKTITAGFTKRPTLLANDALDGMTDDGFRFSLIGAFGAQYRIDDSTNLVDWEQFAIFTNTYGRTQLTDPAGTNKVVGTNGTYRFYRAVELP